MKLSISNIAWNLQDEKVILEYLAKKGFSGIEIAPTKIVGETPYEKIVEAKTYANNLSNEYGLSISSMQSIWYGKNERMFTSQAELESLLQYTKDAILYAEAINCHNLVFGCPKNRSIDNENDIDIAVQFFEKIGKFAYEHNTVVALEPNPTIYGTNFMNTTLEAIDICRRVSSKGIGINFDFGTLIQNKESIQVCLENLDIINHVHISEPYLEIIKPRTAHRELIKALKQNGYNGYVSIEMKEQSMPNVLKTIDYLQEVAL